MKTLRSILILAILTLWASTSALGQSFKTESGHAEFTSSVPLHTFTGTSENLVGLINLDDQTIDFYLDLTTLDTGNSKRDKDMNITLETDDYPFAEFFGKLASDFDPNNNDAQEVTVQGEFKIHGVTREVEIAGTLQPTSDGLQLEAAWELNLEDYDIVPPRLLIVKVDEIQKVRIEATLSEVES